MRADVFLAARLDCTRSAVQHDIQEGRVTRNGKPAKANTKVKEGDVFQVQVLPPVDLEARPENIPLDILYEDQDVIVVNKPRGMVVHPAAGNPDGTLVNALLYHCRDLSGINGVIRPGIVHRLDKDTSGVMICAKNDRAHLSLAEQIQKRKPKGPIWPLSGGTSKTTGGISKPSWTGIPGTGRKWRWCLPGAGGRPPITKCWNGTGNSPWSAAGS